MCKKSFELLVIGSEDSIRNDKLEISPDVHREKMINDK
jgi:hypothetical protein